MRVRESMAFCQLILCLSLGITSAALALQNPQLVGIVTAVADGHTLKVQLETGPVVVRLANIYAPEATQPGAREARLALDLKVLGEKVALDVVAHDPDEQLVAVVYRGEENVNAWMVKQGHAWAYRERTLERDYCAWENAARSLRRGLWAGSEWVAPWEWRSSQENKKTYFSDYSNASVASCIAEIGRRY
jgi:endonuclease YncB( thermonuclease family)